jgi:DNA-binding MarR family transcriptional regulator
MQQHPRLTALDQVLELTVLLNDDMTASLARDGLTTSRAHLLWVLRETGPTTQRVLAEALGVSARNVTGLVDALEETGFVTREPHPTDRRATLVTCTERGARVTAEMAAGQQELAGLLFGQLRAQDLASLNRSLTHVLDRLNSRLQQEADRG